MQFYHPNILWGLFVLLIPIIIHLFNFRRYRKIYFTNVKELHEISIKTQKNARLKKIIVLLLRMAALAALVFAFAGPYNDDDALPIEAGSKHISIYIDNSFSMEASEGGVSLLDIAKKRAFEISKCYDISDQFQLITNDFNAKQQCFLNRDEFAEEVEKIAYAPTVRSLKEIQTRQDNLFAEVNEKKSSFIISDFQQSTNQLEQLNDHPDIRTTLIPLESETRSNISIDSCWFSSPIHQVNEINRLFVKVHNSAKESFKKIPIRLTVNGKQVGLANFDIDPKSETIIEIPFTLSEQGFCKAILSITDFPITFDDTFFFTFSISEEINIIELTNNLNNPYLNKLFGKDSAFHFTKVDINHFDFSLLETASLVVLSSIDNISSGLSDALQSFVERGNSIVIFYPIEPNDHLDKLLLRPLQLTEPMFLDTIPNAFEKLAMQDVFFSDVFERIPENMEMPTVLQHWDFAINVHSDPLISFENGAPALLRSPCADGLVYLFPFPMNDQVTNFTKQSIFVPVMLRIALMSVQNTPLYQTIGLDKYVAFRNINIGNDVVPHIVNEQDFSFIPGIQNQQYETRFFLYDNIKESGFLNVVSGKDTLCFAMNYNRKESLPDCFSPEMLNDFIKEKGFKNIKLLESSNLPVSQSISILHQGNLLWRWFILIVLLCLLGEVCILRFWK